MNLERIATDGAPAAIGPYSQAIVAGDIVFCSGQLGTRPGDRLSSSKASPPRPSAPWRTWARSSRRPAALRRRRQGDVFLADIADFPTLNGVYATFFAAPDRRPVRRSPSAPCRKVAWSRSRRSRSVGLVADEDAVSEPRLTPRGAQPKISST